MSTVDIEVGLSEEGQCPHPLRFVLRRFDRCDRGVFDDPLVNGLLNAQQLVGFHCLVVAEVEPEAVVGNERPFLMDVIAQHLA